MTTVAMTTKLLHVDVYTSLFWSYGNAALENNLTRALVVTLRTCGSATTGRFLRRFTGHSGRPPFSLALQAAPDGPLGPAPGATVLGITTDRSDAVERRLGRLRGKLRVEPGSLATRGIPDAWVLDRKHRVCLLIESKLGPKLNEAQLVRHWRSHLGPWAPERYRPATWAEVGDFFDLELSGHPLRPHARFITREFFEYLDLLGLRPFTVFRPHHLDRGEVRDGFEELVGKLRQLPGRSRGWKVHPWTEPDADYKVKGRLRLGNTGVAFWTPTEGLAVKFALGAGARSDVDIVVARTRDAGWRRRVRDALDKLGPFTAEVKVRAQFAQATNYVPVHIERGASSRSLDRLLRLLLECHICERWSRGKLQWWLRSRGVRQATIDETLDEHHLFNVYGHLLIYTLMPPRDLVDRNLDALARLLVRRLDALERVRAAFST
jgi:hypothetical protein